MLSRFRFARLLWFVLLICAFLAFAPGYAEAEEGLASWYGLGLEGKPTASGVPYNPNGYTAASRTLPLGTKLLVSYGERSVSVTVNDRGPFVAGRGLDLSQGAAQALGLTKVGVANVDWRVANPNLTQGVASQGMGAQQGLPSQQPALPQGVAQPSGRRQGAGSQLPSVGSQQVAPQSDLAGGAAQPLGLTKVSVGEVNDWSSVNPNLLQAGVPQGAGAPQGGVHQPDLLLQGVTQPPDPPVHWGAPQQPSIVPQGATQQPDLGPVSTLEHTKVNVGKVEDWNFANPAHSGGVGSQGIDVPEGAVPGGGVQQPALLPGAAQSPDPPVQRVAQQPQLLQGMSQQPDAPQEGAQQPGLEQGAGQPLEHTKVSVGEVDHWSFATPNLPQGVTPQGSGTLQEIAQGPNLPQGEVQQPSSSQGAVQDVAGGGDYLVQPGETLSEIASRLGTSVDELASSNGIPDPKLASSNGIPDPNVIRSGQAFHLQQPPAGVDPNFIRGQEGFRLDGYVPDLQSSRSGVTVGTGVDIGQMSAADIGALDIPQGLKQKLAPYAGLIGQNAVNFLNSHPLHLTQDEANTLDRLVTQNIVGGVANRFNLAASGNSFANLPPAARTVVTDIAYQYGSNLAQRMPNFWSDVTAGRWDSVAQKLRNFGDRYSTRRNAEADLLQGAMQRGVLGGYVVQPGDTLPQVASRLGTTVDHLVASNGIADPNTIYSGQTLRA